jgi:hypothetical protein
MQIAMLRIAKFRSAVLHLMNGCNTYLKLARSFSASERAHDLPKDGSRSTPVRQAHAFEVLSCVR